MATRYINNFQENNATPTDYPLSDYTSATDLQQEEILSLRKKLKKAKRKKKKLKKELKRATSMTSSSNNIRSNCNEAHSQSRVPSWLTQILQKGVANLIESVVSHVIDRVVSNWKQRIQKSFPFSTVRP